MIPMDPLQWESRTDAPTGVRIYRLAGALSDSDQSLAFLTAARDAMRADPHHLLLDLGGVGQMTSAGVGVVIAVHRAALDAGRTIALAALSRRTEMVLEISQVLRFVATFADECTALEGCVAGGWQPAA